MASYFYFKEVMFSVTYKDVRQFYKILSKNIKDHLSSI